MPDPPQPTSLPPGEDPLLGRTVVGKFRLQSLLGEGAMGRVYVAEHLSLSQQIAVKVLHPHLTGDESLARRFHREAKSAFTLNHPNSITIYDFGQDEDGLLYIAMELLEGRSLHDVLAEQGPMELDRVVRILSQVCLALDEAHHKGIVHRDLKPENVMVQDRRGEPDFVKVCDFGIAKVQDASGESAITMAGMVCGTPEYMSPEQARGDPLDGRSDLYSLGVILYQMVTERLPFTAETALGCVTKHLTEEPPSPRSVRPDLDIPPVLDAFILRCLDKDPAARPATAGEFRQELERIGELVRKGLGHTTAATSPGEIAAEGAPESAVPVGWRGKRWWVAATVVMLAGAVGVYLGLVRSKRDRDAPKDTTASALLTADAGAPQRTPDAQARLDLGSRPDAAASPLADASSASPVAERRVVHRHHPRHRRVRRRPRPPAPRDMARDAMPAPPRRPSESPFDKAFKAARAAWASGSYSKALLSFRAALRARPGHGRSMYYIGKCYVRLGKPCAALRWFKRYQRHNPKDFFVRQYIKRLSSQGCGR